MTPFARTSLLVGPLVQASLWWMLCGSETRRPAERVPPSPRGPHGQGRAARRVMAVPAPGFPSPATPHAFLQARE